MIALLPLTANAQSDRCDEAPLVGPGDYEGSTLSTTSDGESSCGSSDSSPDAWFLVVPESDCILNASTFGSAFDTVLAVHSGCPSNEGNEIACNDDDKGVLQSRVSFFARAGTEYRLRVTGFSGARGSYVLTITCDEVSPPAQGDTCVEALAISPGQRVSGTTTGSVSDGAASCGQSGTGPDAWYSVTVPKECFLVASTCPGADFDTVLSVHRSCPGGLASEITCNDDACDLRSTIGFVAEPAITYLIRVSGFNGASGTFVLDLVCVELPEGDGPDMVIRDVDSLEQRGRLDDHVGLSLRSVICNLGNEPIDWFANPDPRHPFLVFNAYRLLAGRLEQIGKSWVKHGFSASEDSICGTFCIPTGGSQLGVGCGDVYGVETNAFQENMSPRHEINPWNGEFVYAGSHIDVQGDERHDPVEHRLEIADDDLDPALNVGAEYFVELYVVGHDDVNHTNSIGHRAFVIDSGAPGGTWRFRMADGVTRVGTILESWPDATVTAVPETPVDDGRVYLAVRTTENGDGSWHYEYALFNLDLDRGIASVRIPLDRSVAVTGSGFHAVRSNGEGYSNEPWSFRRTDTEIIWSTETFEQNPASNPLRWGTLHNVRFDAEAPPVDGTVELGVFKPGEPSTLLGATTVPRSREPDVFARGDCDGDGATSNPIGEALVLLAFNFLGASEPPCLAACDFDGNGIVTSQVVDAVYILSFAFLGGPPPPFPFPECGAVVLDPAAEADCRTPPPGCL